jgi:hypothetical protein
MSFTTELKVPPDSAFASLVEEYVADAARRSELTEEQLRGIVEAACNGFATIVEKGLVEKRDLIHLVASCSPLR